MPQDSIGTKTIDGQLYILHKVSKGEGVYGISKKYGVTASAIYESNEGSDQNILIDQILLIPKGKAAASSVKVANTSTTKVENKYHTVSKGQTLSSIARKYNTSVSEIKSLNNLSSDNIMLGQTLLIEETKIVVNTPKAQPVEPKPAEVVKKEVVVAKQEEKPNSTWSNAETISNSNPKNVVVPSTGEVVTQVEKNQSVKTKYSTDDGDEVSEKGLAIISTEGELNQDRSFIMHPKAKVGTIVMITNPENNNTVFARVIANSNTDNASILKMSKSVASKLGVSENTEVKVSYAK
jgi:LysM repeat protein